MAVILVKRGSGERERERERPEMTQAGSAE